MFPTEKELEELRKDWRSKQAAIAKWHKQLTLKLKGMSK